MELWDFFHGSNYGTVRLQITLSMFKIKGFWIVLITLTRGNKDPAKNKGDGSKSRVQEISLEEIMINWEKRLQLELCSLLLMQRIGSYIEEGFFQIVAKI